MSKLAKFSYDNIKWYDVDEEVPLHRDNTLYLKFVLANKDDKVYFGDDNITVEKFRQISVRYNELIYLIDALFGVQND